MELRFEHWRLELANWSNGYIRTDWPVIVETLILLPCIILDGLESNVEYFVSGDTDIGNVFNYDSVILITLDVILFIKFFLVHSQERHTVDDSGRIDIEGLLWAVANAMYTLLLACVLKCIRFKSRKLAW
jgi:hypothetical protein